MYELIKTLPYSLQVSLLLLPVLGVLIAASAFAINVRQTIFNNQLGRAKIVSDALHNFIDGDMMQTAFYKIEYGEFKYDDNFHGSAEEREIDMLS